MANLSSKIVEYCKSNGVNSVDFTEQVQLQDNSDGAGAFIAKWNLQIPRHETGINMANKYIYSRF